jgi:hypothetical protein
MSRELKVPIDEIRSEMLKIVIPFAQENGCNQMEALQLAARYGYERSKDWEWETYERAFSVIKSILDEINSPMNRFQRKYGRFCLN